MVPQADGGQVTRGENEESILKAADTTHISHRKATKRHRKQAADHFVKRS